MTHAKCKLISVVLLLSTIADAETVFEKTGQLASGKVPETFAISPKSGLLYVPNGE